MRPVRAFHRTAAGNTCAESEHHGLIPLLFQLLQLEIHAHSLPATEAHAHGMKFFNKPGEYPGRQAIFGNAVAQHASGFILGFKHRHGKALAGQLGGTCQSCGAGAHHGHRRDMLFPDGRSRSFQRPVTEKAFDTSDIDGAVNTAARALALTEARAHAARDGGQRIAFPAQGHGFLDGTQLKRGMAGAYAVMDRAGRGTGRSGGRYGMNSEHIQRTAFHAGSAADAFFLIEGTNHKALLYGTTADPAEGTGRW